MRIDPVDVIVEAALSVPGRIVSTAIAVVLGYVAAMVSEELYYSLCQPLHSLRSSLFSIFNPPGLVVAGATVLYSSVCGIERARSFLILNLPLLFAVSTYW